MPRVNPPKKPFNTDRRSREHLTPKEIERVIDAARKVGRKGYRDSTMILLAFRHGLRVSELISLRWDQVDMSHGLLHVRRLKNGVPSTHPLRGPEIRALRKLRRENSESAYVFIGERRGPLSRSSFLKIVVRAGKVAEIPFPIHPHMLRHSTGFKLANDGHDTRAIQHYMGHKNIQNTVKYTELSAHRFDNFWDD